MLEVLGNTVYSQYVYTGRLNQTMFQLNGTLCMWVEETDAEGGRSGGSNVLSCCMYESLEWEDCLGLGRCKKSTFIEWKKC